MIALMLLPSISIAATPAIQKKPEAVNQDSNAEGEVQPKFIWGILIKYAVSKVFEVFFEWASQKIFHGMQFSPLLTLDMAVSKSGDAQLAPAQKGGFAAIIPNVTDNAPSAPLQSPNGKENYQGVIFSLLVLQPGGESYAVRPLSEGFKSGEKFRIRLGSTFAGELSVDNINPQGERSRLYPANVGQIVKIKTAVQVILPLDKDSFFQFDDEAGEEQLIITLRDPRAHGKAAASSAVHRQETKQGTGLVQELSPGKFAAIAESIALQHRQ
ncbi:MAG: hypothetical protein R8K20_05450 [Gallionellaceae bacterium]